MKKNKLKKGDRIILTDVKWGISKSRIGETGRVIDTHHDGSYIIEMDRDSRQFVVDDEIIRCHNRVSNDIKKIDKEIERLQNIRKELFVDKTLLKYKLRRNFDMIETYHWKKEPRTGKKTLQTLEFKYEKTGREISCIITNHLNTILGVGVSKCHIDDEFNENAGMRLAEMRAWKDFYSRLVDKEVQGLE